MIHRAILGQLAVVVTLACSDPSKDQPLVCTPAAGEFGSAACAVLAGQIVDTAGHPLTDISVSFRALRSCACTEFGFDVGPDGAFRQTVYLLTDDPGIRDTVTVTVRAAATGPQYPQPTPTTFITDSIAAVLTFRPNGARPLITFVQIQLPIP